MRCPPAMAKMVDIRRKPDVHRRAVASATVRLKASTIRAVRAGRVEKGDPLAAAEVAALHAMKTVWQVLPQDRKSTRLNSSHGYISYAVFCLKKKKPQKLPPH